MSEAKFPKVTGLPAAVIARDDRQCEWPMTDADDPEFHYCTNEREGRHRYCAQHRATKKLKPAPRRSQANTPAHSRTYYTPRYDGGAF